MADTGMPNGRQRIQIAERAAVALRTVDRYFDRSRDLRANTVEHIERAVRDLGWPGFLRGAPRAQAS